MFGLIVTIMIDRPLVFTLQVFQIANQYRDTKYVRYAILRWNVCRIVSKKCIQTFSFNTLQLTMKISC